MEDTMKTNLYLIAALIAAFFIFGLLPLAHGDDDRFFRDNVKARLSGFQEVPAVSTTGSGLFKAKFNPEDRAVEWELTLKDLEGDVFQTHIHFGKKKTNGGIIAWLCGNVDTPAPVPAGTQACPQSGTVSGTLTEVDVIGPAGQGIEAGEFDEFLRALFNNATYVNVHTSFVVSGEIRGQIKSRGKFDDRRGRDNKDDDKFDGQEDGKFN